MMLSRTCGGACRRQDGSTTTHSKFYTEGRKTCTYCMVSFRTGGRNCPCCLHPLRYRSRAKRGLKYQEAAA